MAGEEWTGPGAGDRVLVIAPHPDDESLALGGLIHRSRRLGAQVRVVFLTSGDGFRACAALRYLRPPTAQTMRRLAEERVGEARAALSQLGVPPSEATFLGYPDRGLADLWLHAWQPAELLRSPNTGLSEVPPAHFRPGAPFCGVSVAEDLAQILQDFAPTHVYHPSTADDHPDHWAAGCFALLALERLRFEGQVRSYLVHRGQWPQPWRAGPSLPLSPPSELKQLPFTWETVPLEPEDLRAKTAALGEHASQQALMGHFLRAFVRRNELVAEQECAAGRTSFPDATRDRWLRACWPAGDFAALELEVAGDELVLTGRLRGRPSRLLTYRLFWKPVSGPLAEARTRCCRFDGLRPFGDGTGRLEDGGVQARFPRPAGRFLFGAAVHLGGFQVDRTPWFSLQFGRHPLGAGADEA